MVGSNTLEFRQWTLEQVFSRLWQMSTDALRRILAEGVKSPLLAAAIAAELRAREGRNDGE